MERRAKASHLLLDEESNNENGDTSDDGKHHDDTGFPLGPVFTLGQLVKSSLAAGDERGIDGGHYDWCLGEISTVFCLG